MLLDLCKISGLSLSTCVLLTTSNLQAQVLEPISIKAPQIVTPTKHLGETLYTGSKVTQKGIEIQGVKASSNIYDALSNLSGINVETSDLTGLNVEQNKVRIRGISSSFCAMTLNGIPNYGLGPIGGRNYIYDMENIETISVYKGGVPSNIGTGVGSKGGAISLEPRWASEHFATKVKQSVGSNNFTKSYLRVDSGHLNAQGTRLSAALSYAKADKWRGEGEIGPRKNLNLSLVHPINDQIKLKLWYNKNIHKQHNYRALSYSEIDTNYQQDFSTDNTIKTYYDYNKGEFENDDVFVDFLYDMNAVTSLSIKPYYSQEDSYTSYAAAAPSLTMVQKRLRDIKRLGSVNELRSEIYNINILAGYHYERIDANVITDNYSISTSGLNYTNLAGIAADGVSSINSPYLKFSGEDDLFKWQLGLKYFYFQDSDVNDPKDADANRIGRNYKLWLPTLGISYDIYDAASKIELYTNYGKNFIRPYSYAPLVNYYKKNKTAFTNIGIKAQDLFDGYTTETSHNLDIGLRYLNNIFELSANLFIGKHKNLLTGIINNRDNTLQYQQNIGEATSYGVEAELNFYLDDTLTIFANPTYNHFTYDQNIKGMNTDSKQVVDTPKWMLKSGIIYQLNNFEFIPTISYLGTRYGDALNNEKIDEHYLANLLIKYVEKNFYNRSDLIFTLESNNLFNEKYISVINASDDSLETSSYYQGAPRNIMFTMELLF